MNTNLERFKKDLENLIHLGSKMELDLILRVQEEKGKLKKEIKDAAKEISGSFEKNYQRWYTEACAIIKQLLPDRLEEFVHLYRGDIKRKNIDSATYRIQDWLNGIRAGEMYNGDKYYDDFAIVSMLFKTQLEILKSVGSRFESSLHDIAQLVQADLFDSDLEGARELVKNGFMRAAGVIAGVILEKHLAQVCIDHGIKTKKKDSTIGDFNNLLKEASVVDIPTWRKIQRLSDIRNLCGHNKDREPTEEEVIELVDGVEKSCKTLF